MGRRRRAARALAAELRSQAPTRCSPACDVANKAEVEAALAGTLTLALPRIHALVNNAGIFKAAAFLDISEADWDAVIGVNLKGAFLVAQGGGAWRHNTPAAAAPSST